MSGAARHRTVAGGDRALGELVASLGDPHAAAEGRAFVDGKRETDARRRLRSGEIVDVYAARASDEPVRVLGEHAGLVIAYKPAQLATEPDRQGAPGSLVHAVARSLGVAPQTLHAVSRLDVGVSGAVVLARRGAPVPATLERRYVGVTERAPEPERGSWNSPVRMRGRDKSALTRFATVGRARSGAALLALELETGRTHQIRIHASRAGVPLLGDRAHGGSPRRVEADGSVRELERIALHAIRVRTADSEAIAPVPSELVELWASLGGDGADFERALVSEVGP